MQSVARVMRLYSTHNVAVNLIEVRRVTVQLMQATVVDDRPKETKVRYRQSDCLNDSVFDDAKRSLTTNRGHVSARQAIVRQFPAAR